METWRLVPTALGSLAASDNVLAAASVGQSADSVQWFDLSTRPPKRIARMQLARDQGWIRSPYRLHPLDHLHWWLVSERRLALIDLTSGEPRIEADIELPPSRIAAQAVLRGATLFGLQTQGGYWQWRDGELRQGSSVITGGEPPQPEQVQLIASMFRVDLATAQITAPANAPAGALLEDRDGVAILGPGAVTRFDPTGCLIETLPAPVPASILQHVAAMPYNYSWKFALSSALPGEYLLDIADDELVRISWTA